MHSFAQRARHPFAQAAILRSARTFSRRVGLLFTLLIMLLVALLMTSLSSSVAAAQDGAAATEAGNGDEQDGELIRIEDLSRFELNNYINEAEEQFYARFNALNSTDRYDITCRKEKRVGSNIPVRACTPKFFTEAMADSASNFMFDTQTPVTDNIVASDTKPEMQRLQEEMLGLMQSDAQLREIAGILKMMRARREQLAN